MFFITVQNLVGIVAVVW